MENSRDTKNSPGLMSMTWPAVQSVQNMSGSLNTEARSIA